MATNSLAPLLTVGAAAAIASTGTQTGQDVVAPGGLRAARRARPGLSVALYAARGVHARKVLAELKEWMGANNAAIMAVLLAVIGAKLLGDGIAAL
jgi:hypothetical protein